MPLVTYLPYNDIVFRSKLGLDVKVVPTEDVTEKVEIVEDIDQDQAIEEEASLVSMLSLTAYS